MADCREIVDDADPVLPETRRLYESALDADERIPWEWLARTPGRRAAWKPGQRRAHLVVAEADMRPVGFGYGAFLPGFGGYVCYVAVRPDARGKGVGEQVFRFLFERIADAARQSGMTVPLMIWESLRPADAGLWGARLRLFEKLDGKWAHGLELRTPNYLRPGRSPVRLHLFVRPWDEPAVRFDATRLRQAASHLYDHIYHLDAADPLRRETLAETVNPRLVPAVDAAGEG